MKSLPDSPSEKKITRRGFAMGAAAAAAAIALPSIAPAQSPAPVAQQPSAMSKLSPDSRAEVEARANEIIRRRGSRLDDAQKAEIRRLLAEGQEGLEKMRAYALENGDQPATVFRTWREREGR